MKQVFTVWFTRNKKDRVVNLVAENKEQAEKEFWNKVGKTKENEKIFQIVAITLNNTYVVKE